MSATTSPPPPGRAGVRWDSLAAFAAALSGAASLLMFLAVGVRLWAYPWDWSPDEGLALDYARRLMTGAPALYGSTAVPFPDFYGPVLPALLAPAVAWSDAPLASARLIALLWCGAIAALVAVVVRRAGSPALALLAAGLALAPLRLTVFLLLVRWDGPLMALWLAAAAALLPASLEPGADRLGGRRAALGGAAILLGVLTKPTAVLLGAPLVLGWARVDPPGFRRLATRLTIAGGLLFGLMLLATDGGYAWSLSSWRAHRSVGGQLLRVLSFTLYYSWAVQLFAIGGIVACRRRGVAVLAESSWLLWLGAACVIPLLSKAGAAANSLLPLVVATAILGARLWAQALANGRRARFGPVLGAVCCLALGLTTGPRLPDRADEITSRFFYDLVLELSRDRQRPLLATTPDYAYFLAGQPVEVHGSALPDLERAGTPGIGRILARLEQARYGVVVIVAQYWPENPRYSQALQANYQLLGSCSLGHYYGVFYRYHIFAPGPAPALVAPEGARCEPRASRSGLPGVGTSSGSSRGASGPGARSSSGSGASGPVASR